MKISDYKLILASGSPRRSELLRACGLAFEVADKYSVDEVYPATLPPDEVPLFLAELKSDAYLNPLASNEILLTADTVVILDGQILGKPADAAQAREMLARLSGRTHRVVTGVVLRGPKRRHAFGCTTDVTFAPLTDEQINYYVSAFSPLDKAGAYAIQEWIGAVGVERIDGPYNNVVGLPTAQLCIALEKFIQP